MKRFVFHIMAVVLIIALSGASFIFDTPKSEAQEQSYEKEIVLRCVWPNGVTESFILNGPRKYNQREVKGDWTILKIYVWKDSIDVELKNLDGKKLYITFNNGWPCRLETTLTPTVKPESDNFAPLED